MERPAPPPAIEEEFSIDLEEETAGNFDIGLPAATDEEPVLAFDDTPPPPEATFDNALGFEDLPEAPVAIEEEQPFFGVESEAPWLYPDAPSAEEIGEVDF